MTIAPIRLTPLTLAITFVLALSASAADLSPEEAKRLYGSSEHPAVIAAERRAADVRKLQEELQLRLRQYQDELQKLRAEMRAHNGGRPVEGLRETVAAIQQDAIRLRIELFGIEARKDVIEKAMSAARDKAAKQADNDPVAAQLKELVALLEQSVKRSDQLVKSGQASTAELNNAQVTLAEARVKLLERQHSLAKDAGAADLSKLADQLISLSASLSETRARLQTMDDWLQTYDRLQQLMDQQQEVQWHINKLRGMIEHVEKAVLDKRLGLQPSPTPATTTEPAKTPQQPKP